MYLYDINNDELNRVLGLSQTNKSMYFAKLMNEHYPDIEIGSDDYIDVIQTYLSSFYLERLYRNNRFFNEKYTVTYSDKGMLTEIVADRFFLSQQERTH